MMKHYTLYNICNAARTLLITACILVAGSGGSVWGQTIITNWNDIKALLEQYRWSKDVNEFLQLVDNNSIQINTGSIGNRKTESNRYVYDIVWSNLNPSIDLQNWPSNVNTTYSISQLDSASNRLSGYSKKIIYAYAGEEKTLTFQDGGGAENIDGFICWFEAAENESPLSTGATTHLKWGSTQTNTESRTFTNGLAWLRSRGSTQQPTHFKLCLQYPFNGGSSWFPDFNYTGWTRGGDPYLKDSSSPASACQIKYTVPSDASAGTVYRVVFAGSASNKIRTVTNSTITPPEISVRTVYEIHVIDGARCTEVLGNDITIPVNDETKMEEFKKKFVASYEVYKPYGSGTNFRLAEPIGNYYVPDGNTIASPQRVEWTAYGSNGEKLIPQPSINYSNSNGEDCKGEIVKLTFPQNDITKRATFYLIAEAINNRGTKYAAAFRTVHLEPYAETLTQAEIEAKTASDPIHYQERSEAYLERVDTRYEKIVDISFDNEDLTTGLTIENNYLTSRPGVLTKPSYAFANPGDYANRKNSRRSVGRGEYAFYRTLNYPGISTTAQGYNDYFMSRGATTEIRTTYMVDRTYKKTGRQYGYFMYLDATDEPGVITKIDVGELCPHTTLIASAWICDMAHSDGATHADVGFTFKWRAENGTETILAKYYSGVIDRSTTDGVARWKQIFFKFKITDVPTGEGQYILEVANNTPDSNGADYGIDDIQVWRSLPDIRVQREDACNASTLRISSNYETILNNLGWDQGEEVIDRSELSDRNRRKYRYGLMNSNSFADVDTLKYALKTGNVYFSFAYPNPVDSANGTWGQKTEDWVTVNKNLLDGGESDEAIRNGNYHKTIRVALPTDMLDADKPDGAWSKLPTTAEEAYRREIMLNVYAMNDFIADTKRGPEDSTDPYWDPDNDTNGAFGLEQFITDFKKLCKVTWDETQSLHNVDEVYVDKIINDIDGLLNTYNELKKKMYVYLGMPRVRFPWRSEDGTEIFLTNVYVDNTDLRYKGEQRPGETTPATGEYYVIIFSARTVAGTHGDPDVIAGSFNLADHCRLKSPFTVLPATTIKIDTDLENPTTAICEGNLKKVTAILNGYDIDGNDVDLIANKINYIFDWYLSSMEEYEKYSDENNSSIKTDLESYRDLSNNRGPITIEALDNWNGDSTIKERLKQLIQAGLLKTGTAGAETFDLFINVPEIVAMPYVYENNDGGNYTFCTDKTSVLFDLSEENTPDMSTGISGVAYPFATSAPLRLGQLNLGSTTTLSIPVREVQGMSENATHIGPNGRNEVLLNDGATTLPIVGKVTDLRINKPAEGTTTVADATVTIEWNENAKTNMPEGLSHELLIPFAQYNNDDLLTSACEGLASLTVKVVPEYLTWKGKANDAWYNDGNWEQSTEEELYMGNKTANKDANGTDNIQNAFAPLYFTKITINPNKEGSSGELVLNEAQYTNSVLNVDANKATENIQYDMAVNKNGNGTVTVEPYYINRVSEIYFKPQATLMNQHYLTYDMARVEFNMKKGTSYWMSSPLHSVYAGDMYAPKEGGKQNTPAFDYISYSTDRNSRWNPAFYQKAWNKAIAYSTDETGSAVVEVEAVKSNWSIEYNDVWVPYSIGKGFYARVEEQDATVRLPKADTEYGYENKPATRALSAKGDRTNAGRMADENAITITLTDDNIDGDGDHFLVGNPYMTYLDMAKFFEKNTGLSQKYWTIANGSTTASIVGTPDIPWSGNEKEDGTGDKTISGLIPPMTAFFVERADYGTETAAEEATETTPIEIKFTTAMMATQEQASETPSTRSIAATNPVLTLTAERDGKKSRSVIALRDNADNAYRPQEDAIVLLDSELTAPVAYSIAGKLAAQVNAVKGICNLPIGVYGQDKGETTLTIEGIFQLAEPLYLYDAQSGKSTELTGDSHTIRLEGSSHGRYFLRSGTPTGNETIAEKGISIYSAMPGKVVASAPEALKQIRVVDLSGRVVRIFQPNTPVQTFDLPRGTYIIQAQSLQATKVEKIHVR